MARMLGPLAIVLAAATLALALPSIAAAQTGEDQYADPFGELPEEGSGGSDGGGADAGGDPDGEPIAAAGTGDGGADAGDTAAAGDDSVAEPAGTDGGTASDEELARTGLRASLLIALGLGLLSSGALLQLALLRSGRTLADLAPWRTSAVHRAPRPPGFQLPRRRALRRRRR